MLRRKRAAKGTLTKNLRALERATVERCVVDLETLIVNVSKNFDNFERIHDQLTATLGEEDLDSQEEVMQRVHKSYVNAVRDAKRLTEQDSSPPPPKSSGPDLSAMLNLPKVELATFQGDPKDYPLWSRSFQDVVGSAPIDDSAKLARLMQLLKGPAYEAVKASVYMRDGYQHAISMLEKRYGDPHCITSSLVASLKDGNVVHGPQEIRRFADDVNAAFHVLVEMHTLSEVESQSFLIALARRLPSYMQRDWKKQALEMKDKQGHYPSFRDFAQFMESKASDINDPVYGTLGTPSNTRDRKDRQTFAASAASHPSANSNKPRPPCSCCGKNHKLLFCTDFKNKTVGERLDFVKQKHLCEVCLMENHKTVDCKREYKCTVCGLRHSKLIHVDIECNSDVNGTSCMSSLLKGQSHIPLVRVEIGKHRTYAVIDTASDATFCTADLVRKLGLRSKQSSLRLSTLHGTEVSESQVVNFTLRSLDGLETLSLSNVIVVDRIPINVASFRDDHFPQLRDLPIALPSHHDAVQLLIGQDHSEALVPLEVRKGEPGEPFAVRTKFGWSLNGSTHADKMVSVTSHFISASSGVESFEFDAIESSLERLWDMETDNLYIDGKGPSVEDLRVVELWDNETKFVNGHFEIPIPWRPNIHVPNNKCMALRRLHNLLSTLEKKNLREQYESEINKLLLKGYAEAVPLNESGSNHVWYLPHHVVLNPKKPGKFRVVFDCAAKYDGVSLNNLCYSGPDLNNRLINVLLRFREHQHAVSADVEAMYYQVMIPESDRDALRFLWVDDLGSVCEYRMTRHLFGGVWCASSATYALRKSIERADSASLSARDAILNSFYVDDCLRSEPSEVELKSTASETVSVLHQGGFNLTKFSSNSNDFLCSLTGSQTAIGLKEVAPTESRVLGLSGAPKMMNFFSIPFRQLITSSRDDSC